MQIDGRLLDALISLNADRATIQESGGREGSTAKKDASMMGAHAMPIPSSPALVLFLLSPAKVHSKAYHPKLPRWSCCGELAGIHNSQNHASV